VCTAHPRVYTSSLLSATIRIGSAGNASAPHAITALPASTLTDACVPCKRASASAHKACGSVRMPAKVLQASICTSDEWSLGAVLNFRVFVRQRCGQRIDGRPRVLTKTFEHGRGFAAQLRSIFFVLKQRGFERIDTGRADALQRSFCLLARIAGAQKAAHIQA